MMKKYRGCIIFFYSAAAILLVFASFFDLQIDIALNDPDNVFAVWLYNTGELPCRLICPVAGALIFRCAEPVWQRIAGVVLCIGGSAYLGYYIGKHFFVEDNRLLLGILFGVGLGAALLYAFCYINIPNNKKSLLLALAVIGVVVMAVQLTAVEGMKYLWGRVRFRDLAAAGDYSAFTPWYHINGINGSKSFPSGHAAGAGMIFLAMLLPCASQKRSRYAVLYFAVPFAYTAAVAYTRLVMGAHYLSDVTAGALISFTLAVAAVKLFESRILPSITDKNRQ